MLYPETFDDKEEVVAYLEAYNTGRAEEDQIFHTDLAETISNDRGIINGITIVLVAFAAISLIVSLIMISIITYTSVLERTKEIGALRSLGARKRISPESLTRRPLSWASCPALWGLRQPGC